RDHRRICPRIACSPGGTDRAKEIESIPNAEDHGAIRFRSSRPRSAGISYPTSSVPADLVDTVLGKTGAGRERSRMNRPLAEPGLSVRPSGGRGAGDIP